MRPAALIALVAGVLAAGSFQGCAASAPDNQSRALQRIELESPALSGHAVPPGVICRPNSIWLPLRWAKLPSRSGELVLTMVFNDFERRSNSQIKATMRHVMVVGGLRPSRRELNPGPLPAGAFVEFHGDSRCPGPREETGVVFTLFALPRGHHFGASEVVTMNTVESLESVALASGALTTVFGRGR